MNIHTRLFLLLFIAINSFCYSQEIVDIIKINKDERNITNLSGKFSDTISFNLIINKIDSSKIYKSTLFLYDKEKQIKVFNPIKTKEKPNFISYHSNDNILTIIRSVLSEIEVYDFDFKTGAIKMVKSKIKPNMILSDNNYTFITSQYENEFIKLVRIKSSNNIVEMIVTPKTKKERKLLFNLNNKNAEFINSAKYIEKGSIKKYRGFNYNDNLVFINDNKKEGIVSMFTIDESGKITTREYDVIKGKGSNKQNSFIKDNLLFIISLWKKNALLSIYDIKSAKLLVKYNYDDTDNFGPYNRVIFKGDDITENFRPKKFFRSFFSAAIGTVYNAKLYIGVNKTKNNYYTVQVGHVDKNTFYNNSSGNSWWNYPAFSLNYNITTGSISGGINPAAMGMMVFDALAEEKRKGVFFELNLKNDLSINESKQENDFYKFDLEMYNLKLKRMLNIKLKRYFYIPMKDDYVRFINFDKKTNTYNIYNFPKR